MNGDLGDWRWTESRVVVQDQFQSVTRALSVDECADDELTEYAVQSIEHTAQMSKRVILKAITIRGRNLMTR